MGGVSKKPRKGRGLRTPRISKKGTTIFGTPFGFVEARKETYKRHKMSIKFVEHKLDMISVELKKKMQSFVPLFTGYLRGSIVILPTKRKKRWIGSPVAYAASMELGAKAHQIPHSEVTDKLGTLRVWVKQKWGASGEKEEIQMATILKRHIAKKGTEAHPFIMPAYGVMLPKFVLQVNKVFSHFGFGV